MVLTERRRECDDDFADVGAILQMAEGILRVMCCKICYRRNGAKHVQFMHLDVSAEDTVRVVSRVICEHN